MGWLFRHNWPWALLAFLLGAFITWFVLVRREQGQAGVEAERRARKTAEKRSAVLVGVGAGSRPASTEEPASIDETASIEEPASIDEPSIGEAPAVDRPAPFSRRMDPNGFTEAALFDLEPADSSAADVEPESADVPEGAEPAEDVEPDVPDVLPGRFGEGSADAMPHQSPPDGFTIKGNVQSMLFHTPDSPYYGRTKPQVWFRTEADAERAGFTKYVRRPRRTQGPRN